MTLIRADGCPSDSPIRVKLRRHRSRPSGLTCGLVESADILAEVEKGHVRLSDMPPILGMTKQRCHQLAQRATSRRQRRCSGPAGYGSAPISSAGGIRCGRDRGGQDEEVSDKPAYSSAPRSARMVLSRMRPQATTIFRSLLPSAESSGLMRSGPSTRPLTRSTYIPAFFFA